MRAFKLSGDLTLGEFTTGLALYDVSKMLKKE